MTTSRPAVLPARPAMFAALAVPNFRRYVSGQALSLIGSPVIGALSDTAGPRYALGLGAAACLAAAIIGGWPGGGHRQNTRYRSPLAQM
jgi:hypothetical protein